MSVATLEELEAVPVGQAVTVDASERVGRQAWTRVGGGLEREGTTVPLRSFIGAIADGKVEADGTVTAAGGGPQIGDVYDNDTYLRCIWRVDGANDGANVEYVRLHQEHGRLTEQRTRLGVITGTIPSTLRVGRKVEPANQTARMKMLASYAREKGGVLVANTPAYRFPVGYEFDFTDVPLDMPVGTVFTGTVDHADRTVIEGGRYRTIAGRERDLGAGLTGRFRITSLPVAAPPAADVTALAGAVNQWITDHQNYYLDAALQTELRTLLIEHGVDAALPERAVNVEIYIDGWTEGVPNSDALVTGVDEVTEVDGTTRVEWSHTIRHAVTSAHPNPCEDETLINDEWVRVRLNEAGITFTGFSIEERGCDADE